jgi:hypothetical protein
VQTQTTIETIGLLDEDKEHARAVSKEREGGNNENAVGGSTLESSSARMRLLSTIDAERKTLSFFHCVLLSACYEHDQIQNSLQCSFHFCGLRPSSALKTYRKGPLSAAL